jgi:hypothetical protein
MTNNKERVLKLIRAAFTQCELGDGVGLRQGQGLDDYANDQTLSTLRSQDEKENWSTIPVEDLDQYCSSLSFFDADGMRFHLPAYLVADLEGTLKTSDVVIRELTVLTSYSVSRFDSMSPAQRETVREYLLLRLSDADNVFLRPMIETALRKYWTPTKH